jgi:hypothetical protein
LKKAAKPDPVAAFVARAQKRAAEAPIGRRCYVCVDERAGEVAAIVRRLEAMRADHVTVTALHRELCASFEGFGRRVTLNSLRGHLSCEHDGVRWPPQRVKA